MTVSISHRHEYRGGCHCGKVSVRLTTRFAPPDLPLRRCQCSFCRKHGARTAGDPDGQLEVRATNEAALVRYRFGLRTSDFLLCATCGVYIAAVLSDGRRRVSTVNTNLFEDPVLRSRPAEPVSYEGEDAKARTRRRRQRWTPTRLVLDGAAP